MNRQQAAGASPLTTGLLAGVGLFAFYSGGIALQSTFFDRYFCGHPLEYISTTMFFVGMAILARKYMGLRTELGTLRSVQQAAAEDETESGVRQWVEAAEESEAQTLVGRRVRDVLNYLSNARRERLEEHLRYLAELADDRLHQSYSTIRTITWAIPILGFLGTVIGITLAIANVTPEQLDTSLGTVTHGLSVAFDTTALALGLSIILVFASFWVERSERQVLTDVERFGIEILLPRFAAFGSSENDTKEHGGSDIASAVFDSEAWQAELTEFRTMWSATLNEHLNQLSKVLQQELQETLQMHRDQTQATQGAYGAAVQEASHLLVERFDLAATEVSRRIERWQEAMLTSSQESARQSEALHELGATLLRLTESGQQIQTLQQQLNQNLEALQVAETMERTVNSLTAAIHVLTAKTSARHAA